MFHLVEPHNNLHVFWMLISTFVFYNHLLLLHLLSCTVIYNFKPFWLKFITTSSTPGLFQMCKGYSLHWTTLKDIRGMLYLSSSTVSIGCTLSVFTTLIWSANRIADSNRSMPASFPKSTRASLSRCSISSMLISVF